MVECVAFQTHHDVDRFSISGSHEEFVLKFFVGFSRPKEKSPRLAKAAHRGYHPRFLNPQSGRPQLGGLGFDEDDEQGVEC
jgi:hypothetical protein